MRHAVFNHVHVPPSVAHRFDRGVTWAGWRLPIVLEFAIVAVVAVALLTGAIVQFSRTD